MHAGMRSRWATLRSKLWTKGAVGVMEFPDSALKQPTAVSEDQRLVEGRAIALPNMMHRGPRDAGGASSQRSSGGQMPLKRLIPCVYEGPNGPVGSLSSSGESHQAPQGNAGGPRA